jgi:hypothetical protein
MKIVLEDGFLRRCRSASAEERSAVLDICANLRATLANAQQHTGLGLRKLNPFELWEVRVGLKLRALFFHRNNSAVFVFLGTHDEVQAFLRHYKRPATH